MKKSDLENGMIVECRNGNRYIVIKDFKSIIYHNVSIFLRYPTLGAYNTFKQYNDDLFARYKEYDIMKVYCRKSPCSNDLVLLWERKEKPKIKLTDDERKLLEVAYNQGYRWIIRNRGYNHCTFHMNKPVRKENYFVDNSRTQLFCEYTFCGMFQFIKWEDEEPYSIEELLKGE